MGTVLGLGPGLFGLVLLWFLVLLVFTVSFHAHRSVALSAVIGATLITLLLRSIPIKSGDEESTADDRIVDPLYVWRLALVVLVGLAAVGGGAMVLMLHYNERVLAKPLRRFGPD